MDQGSVTEHVKLYAEAVRQSMAVSKIVLYGSQVTGTARPDSDIDVAVIVPKLDGDWLTSSAKLFKLTRDIDLRIEPVLFEEGQDPSGFLDEVLRTGEVVYSSD